MYLLISDTEERHFMGRLYLHLNFNVWPKCYKCNLLLFPSYRVWLWQNEEKKCWATRRDLDQGLIEMTQRTVIAVEGSWRNNPRKDVDQDRRTSWGLRNSFAETVNHSTCFLTSLAGCDRNQPPNPRTSDLAITPVICSVTFSSPLHQWVLWCRDLRTLSLIKREFLQYAAFFLACPDSQPWGKERQKG